MRVIAAPERDVHCPRDEAIGCEGSLAGQQPRILDALDARADVLWPQPRADIRGFEPGRSLATVCHKSRPPFFSQCGPLRIVVTADHRGSVRLDRPGYHRLADIPGVARG